ncbi:MAG: metallophosphatase domain-containing protein [Candidatus Hodarchaeales archaeon]|jgi:Icc-related predicted phosphoesterase
MRITFISDTHGLHEQMKLPGGDVLVHAGDSMNWGTSHEFIDFLTWMSEQNGYYTKIIFIAGNHDRFLEDEPELCSDILEKYVSVTYLQDAYLTHEGIKFYGSPWQPEFYNWAFNLPRGGKELEEKWAAIPADTDLLITHGPPQGHLDTSGSPYNEGDLGCEWLRVRTGELRPKIHVFGHIHGSYGYKFYSGTHFINAAVVSEGYELKNKPFTVDWKPKTNELEVI